MSSPDQVFSSLFPLYETKMAKAGVAEVAIRAFAVHFRRLAEGELGLIPEQELEPVQELPDAEALDPELVETGADAVRRTVLIRLNGGLGTGMGLESPKSLLAVKEGRTFLDLIVRESLQEECPLLLMDSYSTHQATVGALAQVAGLPDGTGGDPGRKPIRTFVQHQVPRIRASDWHPVEFPERPELEWCPPGHGDIYHALQASGLLEQLLAEGWRFAFVANSDNLGARLDLSILGYLVRRRLPFLMEVTERTPVDAKGGHLARRRSDEAGLLLRELAQCPEDDLRSFQDIRRHRFFNTNNLWLDLEFLRDEIARTRWLQLPMICNRKPLLPSDPESLPVIQLESAMGSAISQFGGAGAIRVSRRRFAPVKTCSDLLVVRSDATLLEADGYLVPHPERSIEAPPLVFLDPDQFRTVPDLEARFPAGPPSLLHCRSLRVEGDVRFTSAPVCVGDVHIINRSPRPVEIDASRLEGTYEFDG